MENGENWVSEPETPNWQTKNLARMILSARSPYMPKFKAIVPMGVGEMGEMLLLHGVLCDPNFCLETKLQNW